MSLHIGSDISTSWLECDVCHRHGPCLPASGASSQEQPSRIATLAVPAGWREARVWVSFKEVDAHACSECAWVPNAVLGALILAYRQAPVTDGEQPKAFDAAAYEIDRLKAELNREVYLAEKARQDRNGAEAEAERLRAESRIVREQLAAKDSALQEVKQTYENSARADSKGSGHYSVPFFWAVLAPIVERGLAGTVLQAPAAEDESEAQS